MWYDARREAWAMLKVTRQTRAFFNLSEIAERWGTSVATVLRHHVQNEKLMTVRQGKAHLVKREDLIAHEVEIRNALQARIQEDIEKLRRLDAPLPTD